MYTSLELAREQHSRRLAELETRRAAHRAAAVSRLQRRAQRLSHKAARVSRQAERAAAQARLALPRLP